MYHSDFGLFIGFRARACCFGGGCLGVKSRLRSSRNFLIEQVDNLNPQIIKA